MELSEFEIRYKPRTSIKDQVLVDFIAEFSTSEALLEELFCDSNNVWILHVDASSNAKG